jgi:hypothetical protein
MADPPTDWLTDRPTDWLADQPTNWLTDWLTDWLAGWLTDWQADRLTGWLTGRPTNESTDWLTGWLTDWLTDRLTTYSRILPQILIVPQPIKIFPIFWQPRTRPRHVTTQLTIIQTFAVFCAADLVFGNARGTGVPVGRALSLLSPAGPCVTRLQGAPLWTEPAPYLNKPAGKSACLDQTRVGLCPLYPLKSAGYYRHHLSWLSGNPHFIRTVCMCCLWITG